MPSHRESPGFNRGEYVKMPHDSDRPEGYDSDRQLFAALAVIVESIAATSEKCVMNTFEDHALCLTHYVNGETDSRTCGYMKALHDIELCLRRSAQHGQENDQ